MKERQRGLKERKRREVVKETAREREGRVRRRVTLERVAKVQRAAREPTGIMRGRQRLTHGSSKRDERSPCSNGKEEGERRQF